MKVVIIIILMLLLFNTFLLIKHIYFSKPNVERFFEPANPTMTRVGPYEGISSCSGIGIRTIYDNKRPIGDDSFIFNGPSTKSITKENYNN